MEGGEKGMKTAIVGSRTADAQDYWLIGRHIPAQTTLIISGGARGADGLARRYAQEHGLPLEEFLPDYKNFGKMVPIFRNNQIVRRADYVMLLWDGKSPGSRHVISLCLTLDKPFIALPIGRRQEQAEEAET